MGDARKCTTDKELCEVLGERKETCGRYKELLERMRIMGETRELWERMGNCEKDRELW